MPRLGGCWALAALTVGMFAALPNEARADWVATTTLPGAAPQVAAWDPNVTSTVYAAGFGRLFNSANSGQSWSATTLPTGLGSPINSLAVQPGSSNVILLSGYIPDNGLALNFVYRSADGGKSWIQLTDSHSEALDYGQQVAFDPVNSNIAYAAMGAIPLGADSYGNLARSVDGGVTFAPIAQKIGSPFLAVPQGSGTVLYAADYTRYSGEGDTPQGLSMSTDQGTTWTSLPVPISTSPGAYEGIFALAADYHLATSVTVYVATAFLDSGGTWDCHIFKSANSGTSWVNALGGQNAIADCYPQSLVLDPANPATLYLARGSVDNAPPILRSTNSGHSWKIATTGFGTAIAAQLAVKPGGTAGAPATLIAATESGTYVSTNSANRWNPSNTGLNQPMINKVAANPGMPNTIYAATLAGVFRSANAGVNWVAASNGLTNVEVRDVTADPATSTQALYAATAGGIFHSTDGGRHWTALPAPNSIPDMSLVAADPHTAGVIYAASNIDGSLWVTQDSGAHWNAPLPQESADEWVTGLATEPTLPGTVYVWSPCYVFASTDGGATFQVKWQWSNDILMAAAYVPAKAPRPGTLYILLQNSQPQDTLLTSTDGGQTWTSLGSSFAAFGSYSWLTGDAATGKLFASSTELGNPNPSHVFESANGGLTWSDVTGGLSALMPFKATGPIWTTPGRVFVASYAASYPVNGVVAQRPMKEFP